MTSGRERTNPWLEIPSTDYEGHMSQPGVGQLAALSAIFARSYALVWPARVLVLGAATGNGLEHIRPDVTGRVVAADVNADYLELARVRFGTRLPGLETVAGDVADLVFEDGAFDWISAALLFEYVDPKGCLPRISSWLSPGGRLDVVLQRASAVSGPVSATRFESLRKLAPFMRLVPPASLRRVALQAGLASVELREVALPGGKSFHVEGFARAR